MRYLFVVQGEGRGHLTQALSLASILRRQGHEVVKVLVGRTRHRQIPEFFLREIDALSIRSRRLNSVSRPAIRM